MERLEGQQLPAAILPGESARLGGWLASWGHRAAGSDLWVPSWGSRPRLCMARAAQAQRLPAASGSRARGRRLHPAGQRGPRGRVLPCPRCLPFVRHLRAWPGRVLAAPASEGTCGAVGWREGSRDRVRPSSSG